MTTFPQLELHRLGFGLVPPPGSTETAIHVETERGRPMRSCTCPNSRNRTCRHLKALSQELARYRKHHPRRAWDDYFAATVWHRLARLIFEAQQYSCADVRVAELGTAAGSLLQVSSPKGDEIAFYLDSGPARLRFLERLGKTPPQDLFADRAGLLERLALFQMKPEEREMNQRGFKTGRQVWQESFWHRLAYHCAREFDPETVAFEPAIDETTGDFTLTFRAVGEPVCRITLPRKRVEAVLKLLARAYPEQPALAIHPVPLQSLFHVAQTTDLDLEVRPMIRALQEGGEERFYSRDDLKKFTYGRLVYLPEMKLLAELERDRKKRKFAAPVAMKLERSQVPSFLLEHRDALAEGTLVLDEPLRGLEIFTDYDWVEMAPGAEPAAASGAAGERSWHYLSVRYGFGDETVALQELLEARRKGMPYYETASGWIDLRSDAFQALAGVGELEASGDGVRLSSGQLLRLQAQGGKPVKIAGSKSRTALLRRFLDLVPSRPYTPPAGLASKLRTYQELGVDWLRFLVENGLGGLLCDDMGLGKTHQAMALMLALREDEPGEDDESGDDRRPFLVVCPTSVMSHWRDKIRDHAPGLRAALHHGPERDLEAALGGADVVVTSYGILRNDLDQLCRHLYALVVFDEIQYLKNRGTRSFQAAREVPGEVKLGLTGTPIENSITELKALFDLVLPGYLGSEEAFVDRYVRPGDGFDELDRRAELRRLVSPFVLRRLKASVLDELPEKIEDVRTCELSADQVRLYRGALATQGKKLRRKIEAAGESKKLPYIHIFALLNLLKQICDHPALAKREIERAERYTSGKWELYEEILRECLDSGLKVVVFTQYLGMIELMKCHLEGLGVGYSVLTGASTERGEIVRRFNEDDDCRVFLGSLKAGGTGIDLVGGSVVIHYDRWWNAAREDQATDRVHRIGQKRAVQVFKLVCEGTLEEKIAAIIERKRDLMESVVEEDDPRLAKIFTREELIELLSQEV